MCDYERNQGSNADIIRKKKHQARLKTDKGNQFFRVVSTGAGRKMRETFSYMPITGNLGIPLVATYVGDPANVSLSTLNIAKGTIVIDPTNAVLRQKTSSTDNSAFTTLTSANTGTFTLPTIASGLLATGSVANDFSGSTGTFKTSTGLNTVSGALAVKVVNTAVAAAGSTNSDAAALTTASIQHVSSDSAAKGVILPVGVPGYSLTIINDSATACKIYPDAGGNVNGGTTTTGSVTVPASKGVHAYCTVALTWIVFDLPAKSA